MTKDSNKPAAELSETELDQVLGAGGLPLDFKPPKRDDPPPSAQSDSAVVVHDRSGK